MSLFDKVQIGIKNTETAAAIAAKTAELLEICTAQIIESIPIVRTAPVNKNDVSLARLPVLNFISKI